MRYTNPRLLYFTLQAKPRFSIAERDEKYQNSSSEELRKYLQCAVVVFLS